MSKEKAIIHINNVSKILGTKRIKLSEGTTIHIQNESWHLKSWRIDMKILKRLVYVLLMIPICTIVFVIEGLLLPLIIPAIWVITGSTILRVKETKECEPFYVYTITQIVYT